MVASQPLYSHCSAAGRHSTLEREREGGGEGGGGEEREEGSYKSILLVVQNIMFIHLFVKNLQSLSGSNKVPTLHPHGWG